MKSTFLGFYSVDQKLLKSIWSSDNTLFVFDTNCLLNLYRCEDETRDDILNVMRTLKNRTWIPFQVGLEFQRRRKTVIHDSIDSLIKIKKNLEKIYNQDFLSSTNIRSHLYSTLNSEVISLLQQIKLPIEGYIKGKISPRIELKESVTNHDFIREEIDNIFDGRVGNLPSQALIDNINAEGEIRYQKEQPPGFKDKKKDGVYNFRNVEFKSCFGDLYLWKEIIEKAKHVEIKNVIFVTDDRKDDWWYSFSGKTHGPQADLTTEICIEADIDNFKLINQSTFLYEAKEYLDNINVRESSLQELKDLYDNEEYEEEINLYPSYEFLNKNVKQYNSLQHNGAELFTLYKKGILELQSSIDKAGDYLVEGRRALFDSDKNKDVIVDIIGIDRFDKLKMDMVNELVALEHLILDSKDLVTKPSVIDGAKISEFNMKNLKLLYSFDAIEICYKALRCDL